MSNSDVHISDFKFSLNHFYHIWEARCELWLEGNGSSEGGIHKLKAENAIGGLHGEAMECASIDI